MRHIDVIFQDPPKYEEIIRLKDYSRSNVDNLVLKLKARIIAFGKVQQEKILAQDIKSEIIFDDKDNRYLRCWYG